METRAAQITDLDFGITAIDTEYVRPMLDASHLIVEGDRAAFVDTGTNRSVDLLLDALRQKNIDPAQVEFVFLTHVHLDHAGGAGELMSRLPNATAVLHVRGARHMINPAELVNGAQAVYGEALFADMYGDIKPIPEKRVRIVADAEELHLSGRPLQCLYTEGHARHHYCLADPASRGVFTGDSFGVSYRELDTAAGEFIFPTTTPVQFDPVEAHRAIDRIMGLRPERLYLTHYSQVTGLPRLAGDMHRRLDGFVSIARRCANDSANDSTNDSDRTAAMQRGLFLYLKDELKQHGFEADDGRLHAIVGPDVQLNTMGLEYWLDNPR